MSKDTDERARQIYDEMMRVLEKHGDDKEVVHAVLLAFVGAYWKFVKEESLGRLWPA